MDPSTVDVYQDRERARSAITEKIELLEETVRDRVEGAKKRVKQTFDIRYHVDQRPWQMLGLSVLAGYLVGRMIAGNGSEMSYGRFSRHGYAASDFDEERVTGGAEPYTATTLPRAERARRIVEPFRDELEALKAAAIAAVVSVVKDLLKTATSSVKDTTKAIGDERGRHESQSAAGDLTGRGGDRI